MPKRSQSLPDFDAEALLTEVHRQDFGLSVTTNNPASFKRRLYQFMAKAPRLKTRILSGLTPNSFLLVRPDAIAQVPSHEQ